MKIKNNTKRNIINYNPLSSSLSNPLKRKYIKNIDNNIKYDKNESSENENISNENNKNNNEEMPKLSIKVKNNHYNYFNSKNRNNNKINLKDNNKIYKVNNYNEEFSNRNIKTPKRLNNDKFNFENSINFIKDRRFFSGEKKGTNLNLFSPLSKTFKKPKIKQKYNNYTKDKINNNIKVMNKELPIQNEDYKYYDISLNKSNKSLQDNKNFSESDIFTNFELVTSNYNNRITNVKKLSPSNNQIKNDNLNYDNIKLKLNEKMVNNPMIIFNNEKINIINNNINIKNLDLREPKQIDLNINKYKNEKGENNFNIDKDSQTLLNNKIKSKIPFDNIKKYKNKNQHSNNLLNQNIYQQNKLIPNININNTFNNNKYIQNQLKEEHDNINPNKNNLNMESFKATPPINEKNNSLINNGVSQKTM